MELRRDVLLGFFAIVSFYVALAFAAVGLQQRLNPTVHEIERRNVASVMATLEMLELLTHTESDVMSSTDEREFRTLLTLLRDRVSEDGEIAIVDALDAALPLTIVGDDQAVTATVASLRDMIAINRKGMDVRADRAFRLAQGGIWVLVFLIWAGIAAVMVVYRRLVSNIVVPIERIAGAMNEAQHGRTMLRASHGDAPKELRELAEALNRLLDLRDLTYEERARRARAPLGDVASTLLERVPTPTWIVDGAGHILAANQDGMNFQQGERGRAVRHELTVLAKNAIAGVPCSMPERYEAHVLGGSEQVLCIRSADEPV